MGKALILHARLSGGSLDLSLYKGLSLRDLGFSFLRPAFSLVELKT